MRLRYRLHNNDRVVSREMMLILRDAWHWECSCTRKRAEKGSQKQVLKNRLSKTVCHSEQVVINRFSRLGEATRESNLLLK